LDSSIIQNRPLLLEAKPVGFSDKQISIYCGNTEAEVCALRQRFVIRPFIKQIDTVSGEWPAEINYFYLTYHGNQDDIQSHVDDYGHWIPQDRPEIIGKNLKNFRREYCFHVPVISDAFLP